MIPDGVAATEEYPPVLAGSRSPFFDGDSAILSSRSAWLCPVLPVWPKLAVSPSQSQDLLFRCAALVCASTWHNLSRSSVR